SAAADPEPDAVLVGLGAHPQDVLEVQLHRAVLGGDLVPPLVDARVGEAAEVVVAPPQGERRAGLESDADALRHVGQCPSAGWTISVSTPPVDRGGTNTTGEP